MIPKIEDIKLSDIDWQSKALKYIYDLDYSQGTHEILLSGAMGSAKSVFLSYLILRIGLENPGFKIGIGRKVLKDLKNTLLDTILKMASDIIELDSFHKTELKLTLPNGTTIQSFSWDDTNYKKFRSYEFDIFAIEELTETKVADAYEEIFNRIGRNPNSNFKLLISATNPDEPDHWVYDRFIKNKNKTRHVIYSLTRDNPFLAPSYMEQLENNLDPKMARRMLYGEWLSIKSGKVIYHAYDKEFNFIHRDYCIHPNYPFYISYDFNISHNKPLSVTLSQYINDEFHFFDEVVIEGIRTEDSLEEIDGRGYFELSNKIIIQGDATGKSRTTNAKHTNYDIIQNYIANYKRKNGSRINYEMDVPTVNPPLRERHNLVNAYLCNSNNKRRVFVYQKCKTLDEGFRLTKLKENADYTEDDSKPFQHVTTSAGYHICSSVAKSNRASVQLLKRTY